MRKRKEFLALVNGLNVQGLTPQLVGELYDAIDAGDHGPAFTAI